MNEHLRRRYVNDLVGDLQLVGSSGFEQWIKPLWDNIAGGRVQARGLNLEGAAVGGDYDARWPDGSASEASSQLRYFEPPFEKALNDVKHVRKVAPDVEKIRLFCTRVAKQGGVDQLRRAVVERHGAGFELEVWDGWDIAEYIVDVLLRDRSYVARVGNVLPNLRRIAEQNAATGIVPPQSAAYGGREWEEAEVRKRLETSSYVVLWGLSGVGKSQVAVAAANALRSRYDLVMWVNAAEIQSVRDLESVDVRNNGYSLNVRGSLKQHRVLLLLDDVRVDLEVEELAADCDGSRIIVTSQKAFGVDPLRIGFVDREHARRILSSGLECPCPELIVDRAVTLFGGHPLVLELVNRQAVSDDGDWQTVERDFKRLLGDTTQNRETAAKRLLGRHVSAVGPELAFFDWCGSAGVDAGVFGWRFGARASQKLSERAMTVPTQNDVVQLHQLVVAALGRLRDEGVLRVDGARFESDLVEYLTETGHPKGLPFYRVVNRHRELIRRLLRANPSPGALRYAYVHGHTLQELTRDLLGNPEREVAAVQASGCETMAVLSLLETIELDYRIAREGDATSAEAALRERLPIYDVMADAVGNSGTQDVVRHHRAKTLVKLGSRKQALDEFGALVNSKEVGFQARLQVARLSQDDPQQALEMIVSIIEAERADPGKVATSVLLEAFATFRLGFLRERSKAHERKYRGFMAQQIKAAACSGESQPMQTFAAVGADWAFTDEKLFIEVMEAINIASPEDAEDDRARIAVGRVLAAAGKMYLRQDRGSESKARLEQAVDFFRAVSRPQSFGSTHHADALIQLDRIDEALGVLETVVEGKRESYWLLRRSEVHRAKREYFDALGCLDFALEDDSLGGRRATFLEARGDILYEMQDLEFRGWITRAIEVSDSEKNTKRLEERLRAMETGAVSW